MLRPGPCEVTTALCSNVGSSTNWYSDAWFLRDMRNPPIGLCPDLACYGVVDTSRSDSAGAK